MEERKESKWKRKKVKAKAGREGRKERRKEGTGKLEKSWRLDRIAAGQGEYSRQDKN